MRVEKFFVAMGGIAMMILAGCADNPPPQQVVNVPVAAPEPQSPNRTILGAWNTSFSGGPQQVIVTTDQLVLGVNYLAKAVDGSNATPAGEVVFKGKPDRTVETLVVGQQRCANQGFMTVRWVDATLTVNDNGTLSEDLKHHGECEGFPVTWKRGNAASS